MFCRRHPQVQELQRQLDDRDAKVEDLHAQLGSNLTEQTRQLQDLNRRIADRDAQIASLTTTNRTMEGRTRNLAKLQQEFAVLQPQYLSLQSEYKAIKAERDELHERVVTLEEETKQVEVRRPAGRVAEVKGRSGVRDGGGGAEADEAVRDTGAAGGLEYENYGCSPEGRASREGFAPKLDNYSSEGSKERGRLEGGLYCLQSF